MTPWPPALKGNGGGVKEVRRERGEGGVEGRAGDGFAQFLTFVFSNPDNGGV